MKKFVFGLILGAGLAFSVSTYAEEVKNFIGASIQGQFPVTVGGEVITSPGIVVDGISYLPTRTIAELAGFEVKFDADLGIELTKKEVVTGVGIQMGEVTKDRMIEQLKDQINKLNMQIDTAKATVTVTEGFVERNPDSPEWEANLQQSKDFLADLEAQKAELEAQLAEME